MKLSYILFFLLIPLLLFAEIRVENYPFAQHDSIKLSMDIYQPAKKNGNEVCVIYVFGGAFMAGSKSTKTNVEFCKSLADSGYVVAAIDYRLGMKGVKKRGLRALKPMVHSINIATEDLYAATAFLLENSERIGFDKKKVVLSGSSAGAITALQANYELANQNERSRVLPSDFRYAAVISFAGGIYSKEGKPDYLNPPAPTMFFHGVDDKIVKYDFMQIVRRGFFGTNALTRKFKNAGYQYSTWRFENIGHEISYLPMIYYKNEINHFIREVVLNEKKYSYDITVTNHELPKSEYGSWTVKELYKNKL